MKLRVVCEIITCVSAFMFTELEMAILIFLEIAKTAAKLLLQVWTLCAADYAKDAIERDTIFHLRVTACSSSFVSKVLGANWKSAKNFYPVANKFAMTLCSDRK